VVVGAVRDLPTTAAAKDALEALNINLNLDLSLTAAPPLTLAQLVAHYRSTELASSNTKKAFSTKAIYPAFIDNWILPHWGQYPLSSFSGDIAMRIERWLDSIERAPGTKAKIRNILSAIFAHAVRWGWVKQNPIKAVRQSAKRVRVRPILSGEELRVLYSALRTRERLLITLDVPTGMRVGELLALKWEDIDFERKALAIHKSIWHQHVGPVKTEESEQEMPLDDVILADLRAWRAETPYARDSDWIFASPKTGGRQPFWPSALMRHIRRAAQEVGIGKHLSWHGFRHAFSTLLVQNNEDVKTVQSLMRHASSRVTMDVYTHSVSAKKRAAQTRVVSMIRPPAAMPGSSRIQ